jgi:hypothetical protein
MEDFHQHQVEQGMRRYRGLFKLPGAFSIPIVGGLHHQYAQI